MPEASELRERRRRLAVAGGYRVSTHAAAYDEVTLVGVGAILPEVLEAAQVLGEHGVRAGVLCLTSPDLVFRSFQARGRRTPPAGSDVLDVLLPPAHPSPLVTVLDGHPRTLSFLAATRGDRIRCLGVSEFGESSSLPDAYRRHGLDRTSIVEAALDLLGR